MPHQPPAALRQLLKAQIKRLSLFWILASLFIYLLVCQPLVGYLDSKFVDNKRAPSLNLLALWRFLTEWRNYVHSLFLKGGYFVVHPLCLLLLLAKTQRQLIVLYWLCFYELYTNLGL